MRFGLSVIARGADATRANLHRIASRAEEHGYDSIWTSDHFVVPRVVKTPFPGSDDGEFPPDWRRGYLTSQSILAYLAAATRRVRLGTSSLVLPLRNPIQLAKEIATIDVLSEGRVDLGVGVGYSEDEFDVLRVPFHDRGRRMDEAIGVLRAIWTADPAEFHGKEFSFSGVSSGPRPVQRPHPPILVAGYGEASYLRAARLGDGWHPSVVEPDALAPMIDALRAEIERAGRKPDDVPVSLKMTLRFSEGPGRVDKGELTGSAAGIIATLERFAGLGVELIVLDYGVEHVAVDDALRTLDRFENEVLPHLP